MQLTEIRPKDLVCQPFRLIGNEWLMVTAEKPDGTVNTMTASWGGMGIVWRRESIFLFIRPSRYTKEFLDASTKFSICSFGGNYKREMSFLGTVSGRDIPDKIERSGLTLTHIDGYPCFAEATFTVLCDKMYSTVMQPEDLEDREQIDYEWYPLKDYHTMYIGEIKKMFIAK